MTVSSAQRVATPFYEYRHIVGFKDTNMVGNVYFTRHLEWQGRCREMFLREFAPHMLREIETGMCLVTMHSSCDYSSELRAFDEVSVRMRLEKLRRNRVWMEFEYVRLKDGEEERIAIGHQTVGCMRREGDRVLPEPFPPEFLEALRPYSLQRIADAG